MVCRSKPTGRKSVRGFASASVCTVVSVRERRGILTVDIVNYTPRDFSLHFTSFPLLYFSYPADGFNYISSFGGANGSLFH